MQIIDYFKELYKFRELLLTLTLREIKVRYKQTALGASWAIFQPLSMMILFTIVFSYFLKVESQGVPYPIFAFSALLPWTFFSASLSFGSLSVINNSNLVGKVYFPKETLPLASVGAAFLDFIVASIIFVAMMAYYDIAPSLNILLIFPIIFVLIIFTIAISLFSACMVVIWRDIKFVIPLILQIWLFLVPVIYSSSKIPDKFRFLYFLDPLAPLIEGFRNAALNTGRIDFKSLIVATVLSILIFIASYIFFKRNERLFADII